MTCSTSAAAGLRRSREPPGRKRPALRQNWIIWTLLLARYRYDASGIVLIEGDREFLALRENFSDIRTGMLLRILPSREAERLRPVGFKAFRVPRDLNGKVPPWSQRSPFTSALGNQLA